MKTELFERINKIFGGYRLRGIKKIDSRDGQGFSGSIYKNGLKIAIFSDDGWGAGLEVCYINKGEMDNFQKHADRFTPDAARKCNGHLIAKNINVVTEFFIRHLVALTKAIKEMQKQAKKHSVIAIEKSSPVSPFGHLDFVEFKFFTYPHKVNLVEAGRYLSIKKNELIIINEDLIAW